MFRKYLALFMFLPLNMIAQDQRAKDMEAYMRGEETVKEFSGTALVMQNGKKLFERSTLYADREWKIPNSSQAKYRIGSITKQFTAALILKLEEQGKLSVNDKLTKFYSGYPKGDSVTIHMLLNHTSGITNYTAVPEIWDNLHYKYSTDSLIRAFRNLPYGFPPGQGWDYSNSGYYLLGKIIERASGKKYGDYLREQIITPLQLKNTDLESLDSVYLLKARGYTRIGKQWQPATFMQMEGAWSAGAMISTVGDLHTWIKALYQNKVLNPASTKKMLTPEKGTMGYAYGIISDSLKKHPRIWHNGGIHGFSSYLAYFPESDITVVVIANNDADNTDRVALALSRIAFNEKVSPPYIPKEVKLAPDKIQIFVGKYKAPTGNIELVMVNNKLYRRRAGSADVELKPESATRFFYADMSDRFIEFKTEGGKRKAYLISGGETIEIEPVN
jgi:CubicO group peptidase (beta-lactamase class C family)